MKTWFALMLLYTPERPVVYGYIQGEAPLSGLAYTERYKVLLAEIEKRHDKIKSLMMRNTTFTIALFVDHKLMDADALRNLVGIREKNEDAWMEYVYQVQVEYEDVRKKVKEGRRSSWGKKLESDLRNFGVVGVDTDDEGKKKTCL